jgi:hypothetical protein
VSFAAITLCIASQRVIPKVSVYFVMTQSENFWIHLPILGRSDVDGRVDNRLDLRCGDCIELASNRIKWSASVNMATILRAS